MAGINLSQSLIEKQAQAKVRFFDRSLFFMAITFGVLVALYIGISWYTQSLEKTLLDLDTRMSQKTIALKGREVDRVADFFSRLKIISEHIQAEPSPVTLLIDLERLTLPTIQLTDYKYDRDKLHITVAGQAPSLKEIAQQMLAFKRIQNVQQVDVEDIRYNDSGRIDFSLLLEQTKPSVSAN